MTALCGGGSSAPLPLTEPVINMTAIGVEALATLWGFPEMGIPLSLAAGALTIYAVTACATDPPPDPGLTQQDIVDAMAVMDPLRAIPAQNKLQQWFLHRYWWNLCYCPQGVTPPPPVMSNPNTPVGINTGAPSGVNAGPCWSAFGAPVVSVTNAGAKNIIAPWLPSGPGSTTNVPTGGETLVSIPPPNVNSMTWDVEVLSSSTPVDLVLNQVTTNGAVSAVGPAFAHSSVSGRQRGTMVYIPSTTAPYAQIEVLTNPFHAGAWNSSWTGTISFNCTNQPANALVAPCCPPDPLIDMKLDQIMGLVLNLYNRSGPTAWVDGTRHSGLTGAGSFALTDRAVAVRVEVTRLPDAPQILPGNPTFYWDMGFITPLAFDTPMRGWRLVFERQSFQLQDVTDAIAYTLLGNTVVDVVEQLAVAP